MVAGRETPSPSTISRPTKNKNGSKTAFLQPPAREKLGPWPSLHCTLRRPLSAPMHATQMSRQKTAQLALCAMLCAMSYLRTLPARRSTCLRRAGVTTCVNQCHIPLRMLIHRLCRATIRWHPRVFGTANRPGWQASHLRQFSRPSCLPFTSTGVRAHPTLLSAVRAHEV